LGEITSNFVHCDEALKVPQDAAQEAVPNEASPESVSTPTEKVENEGEDDLQNDNPSSSVPGAVSEAPFQVVAIIESINDDGEDALSHSRPEIHDTIPSISDVLNAEAIPESSDVVTSASGANVVSCDAADQCTEREDTVTADSPDSNGTTSQVSTDGNEEEVDARLTSSKDTVPDEIGEATTSSEFGPGSLPLECPNPVPTSDAGVEPDTTPTRQMIVGERNVNGPPSSVDNAAVIATEAPVIELQIIENAVQDSETANPASATECENQILEDNESQPPADCEDPQVDSAKSAPTTTDAAEVVEPSAAQPETDSHVAEETVDRDVEEETHPAEAIVEDSSASVQEGWASRTPDETIVMEEMLIAIEESTPVSDVIDGGRTHSCDAAQTIVIIEEKPTQSEEAAPVAGAITIIATASEEVAQTKITEETPNRREGTSSVADSINWILKGADAVADEPITELRNVTSMTRVMIPDEKRNSKPSVADRWGLSTTMSKVKTKAMIALQGADEAAAPLQPVHASGSDKPTTNDKPTTAKTGWSSPKSVERVLISLSEELAPPSPPSSTSPRSKTGATKVARSSSGRSSQGRPTSSSSRAPAPVSKELTEIEKARLFAASVLAETEKRGAGDSGGSDTAGQPRSSWWKQKVVASLQHEL
jgi:hypothetical protein